MYTDPDSGAYQRHGNARFSEFLFENRASMLCNGNSQVNIQNSTPVLASKKFRGLR